MFLPFLLREVGGDGAGDSAPDGAQGAAAVFVADEAAPCGAEEGGADVAGAGTRSGFGAVGTARVAAVVMAGAVTVAVVVVGLGVDVAFVAGRRARGEIGGRGLVRGE